MVSPLGDPSRPCLFRNRSKSASKPSKRRLASTLCGQALDGAAQLANTSVNVGGPYQTKSHCMSSNYGSKSTGHIQRHLRQAPTVNGKGDERRSERGRRFCVHARRLCPIRRPVQDLDSTRSRSKQPVGSTGRGSVGPCDEGKQVIEQPIRPFILREVCFCARLTHQALGVLVIVG